MAVLAVGSLSEFPTIQAAINAARNGDTIQIGAGVYRESLIINKSISLVGAGRTTVIQPGANNNGIQLGIGSSGTKISGVRVQDGRAGVLTTARLENITIEDSFFDNLERYAVQISNGTKNAIVRGNTIRNVNVGVQVLSDAADITDNVVVTNNRITDVSGIALYLTPQTNGTQGAGIYGNVSLTENSITQNVKLLGNNLSLITLQLDPSENRSKIVVADNLIKFRGTTTTPKGAYGLRVTGNVSELEVTGNTFRGMNQKRLTIGAIWLDTEDATFGNFADTAKFTISDNRISSFNAAIFYDGTLETDIEFDRLGNTESKIARGLASFNDIYYGTASDNVVNGERGSDILLGQEGDDRLNGQSGNDILLGGDGEDILVGGVGRDNLDGGAGKDILTGGAGRDKFRFTEVDVADTITDFNVNEDVINLQVFTTDGEYGSSNPFADYIQLRQQGSQTVVRFDTNGDASKGFEAIAVLQNIRATSLTAANFTFF
jgi:Ca2+-binding RTX toxin-like protein